MRTSMTRKCNGYASKHRLFTNALTNPPASYPQIVRNSYDQGFQQGAVPYGVSRPSESHETSDPFVVWTVTTYPP